MDELRNILKELKTLAELRQRHSMEVFACEGRFISAVTFLLENGRSPTPGSSNVPTDATGPLIIRKRTSAQFMADEIEDLLRKGPKAGLSLQQITSQFPSSTQKRVKDSLLKISRDPNGKWSWRNRQNFVLRENMSKPDKAVKSTSIDDRDPVDFISRRPPENTKAGRIFLVLEQAYPQWLKPAEVAKFLGVPTDEVSNNMSSGLKGEHPCWAKNADGCYGLIAR